MSNLIEFSLADSFSFLLQFMPEISPPERASSTLLPEETTLNIEPYDLGDKLRPISLSWQCRGYLRADEISRLDLNADLVTLSACETGLGKIVSGEGILNLARAFLVADAKRLVVTLWKTDDEATKEFMKIFYQELKASGSPAKALRAARLSFLNSNIAAYRFPYFWSPFVVIGE